MFRKKIENAVSNAINPSSTPTMDCSLKKEFELFKMRKILKKANLCMLTPALSFQTLKSAMDQAKTYGFGSILTFPTAVSSCARIIEGSKVLLYAAVSYPNGEDSVKAKIFSGKSCFSAGANGVLFVLSLLPAKRGEFKQIKKEGEKLSVVFGKKASVKIAVDLSLLSEMEYEKLFRVCKGSRIKTIVLFSSKGKVLPKDVIFVKNLCGLSVEVMEQVNCSKDVLALLESGANGVFSSQMIEAMQDIAASYHVTAQELEQVEE